MGRWAKLHFPRLTSYSSGRYFKKMPDRRGEHVVIALIVVLVARKAPNTRAISPATDGFSAMISCFAMVFSEFCEKVLCEQVLARDSKRAHDDKNKRWQ